MQYTMYGVFVTETAFSTTHKAQHSSQCPNPIQNSVLLPYVQAFIRHPHRHIQSHLEGHKNLSQCRTQSYTLHIKPLSSYLLACLSLLLSISLPPSLPSLPSRRYLPRIRLSPHQITNSGQRLCLPKNSPIFWPSLCPKLINF